MFDEKSRHLFSPAELLSSWEEEVVHLVDVVRVPAVLPGPWLLLNQVLIGQELLLLLLASFPGLGKPALDYHVLAERLQVDGYKARGVIGIHRMEVPVGENFLEMKNMMKVFKDLQAL